jgi:MGT family glycosyltransferase
MSEARRFLFVMWDGGGNVPPELAVARRLVARGHSVRVLGDPTLEPEARTAGCAFSPWTTAPHRNTRDRSGDLFKDYEFTNPLRMIDAYLQLFLAEPAPRWIADTLGEIEARPVDAMVVDFGIPAALVAAEKCNVPAAMLMPNIWIVPTPGIPPFGLGLMPAKGWLGRMRDAILLRMTARLFRKALPAINAARASVGLAPKADVYEQWLAADEVLVQTLPGFDFTSDAMPKHVTYVGPELVDPAWSEPWRSPFAADDRRLVVVGLGSTFQNQAALLQRIVDALAQFPVRAILTLGPTIRPSEVKAADNVVVVQTAPHSQLLKEASLLVTHCGHGTTMKGLAAGVPLVCIPMGRDQNDTAARVVHCGAGVRVKPTASVKTISRAIEQALHTPSHRQAAQRMAKAIASRQGCADAVDRLERLARRGRAVGGEGAGPRDLERMSTWRRASALR